MVLSHFGSISLYRSIYRGSTSIKRNRPLQTPVKNIKCNFWRLSDCNERIRQKLIFLRHGPSRSWVLLENRGLWVMSLTYNLILHVVSHSRSAPAQFSEHFSCQS